jgi:hypothetical protein
MDTFGYPETDVKVISYHVLLRLIGVLTVRLFIKEWLDAVEYPEDCATIPWDVITDTLGYVPVPCVLVAFSC